MVGGSLAPAYGPAVQRTDIECQPWASIRVGGWRPTNRADIPEPHEPIGSPRNEQIATSEGCKGANPRVATVDLMTSAQGAGEHAPKGSRDLGAGAHLTAGSVMSGFFFIVFQSEMQPWSSPERKWLSSMRRTCGKNKRPRLQTPATWSEAAAAHCLD